MQSNEEACLPMSLWIDEIQATVDSSVDDISSIQSRLIAKIRLELLVDVVCYWLPAKKKWNSRVLHIPA